MRSAALATSLAALAAPPAAAATTIHVLAASSLANVFPRIDAAPRYSFSGSDELAAQIRQGAPADVYAAASPEPAQRLYREGLLRRPVTFATNTVVLVTPIADPARLTTVFDLRRRGIKLVIGDAGVPIGVYTRRALARLGLSSLVERAVSQEPNVRSILAKVVLGEADAGFVYGTDARAARGKVRVIRLPARARPSVRYQVGVLARSAHPRAAAAFVRRLLSTRARRSLRGAGFGPPPTRR